MKKTSKIFTLIITCIIMVIASLPMSAFAANQTDYYNYPTPTRVLKYENGIQMNGNDVKWFQCAINNLIVYGDKNNSKLSTSQLNVDGYFGPASKVATIAFQQKYGLEKDGCFGPASRAKMIAVLKPHTVPEGKITTAEIAAVCSDLGYATGKYWTTAGNTNISSCTSRAVASWSAHGSNGYYGYKFSGGIQCYAFALYLMSRVTYLKTGNAITLSDSNPTGGWTKLSASQVTNLQVGDIVRTGTNNNGHSSVVLSVDSNGNCKFVECWGNSNNMIGYNLNFNGKYSTLAQLKYSSSPSLSYVLRYNG